METLHDQLVGVRRQVEASLIITLWVLLIAGFATIGRQPIHTALDLSFASVMTALIVYEVIVRGFPLLGAVGVLLVIVSSWPRLMPKYVGTVGWLGVVAVLLFMGRKPVMNTTRTADERVATHPLAPQTENAPQRASDAQARTNRPKLGDPDFRYRSPPPGPNRFP